MKAPKALMFFLMLTLVSLVTVISCDTSPETNSVDSTVKVTAENYESPGGDPGNLASRLFIWKGFSHKWLRTIVGFSIPHRISTFKSFIDTSVNDEGSSSSSFVMGQNTGVDGNFMKPAGRFQFLDVAGIHSLSGKIHFTWTDAGNGAEYPKAISVIEKEVTVPSEDFPAIEGDNSTVILKGISLKTTCDDAKQPGGKVCNSNGMWPYRFKVAVLPGKATSEGYTFTVKIDIRRAWTPNKGGIPLIEEKPFDERLDFDFDVHYTVITGSEENFAVSDNTTAALKARLRDKEASTGELTLQGSPDYSSGTAALTSFGFELSPHKNWKKFNHLGRYIGKLSFFIKNRAYTADTGVMNADYSFHVWSPDTVCQSNISYSMTARLLQFKKVQVTGSERTATGSICCNSKANAPFFSRWLQCGKGNKGPEQEVDMISIFAQ